MENGNNNVKVMDRVITWVIIVIISTLIGAVLTWVICPLWQGREFAFYIRVFLLLNAINVFATLRIYNSMVQNTRFIIKLREQVHKLLSSFVVLDRSLRSLKATNDILNARMASNTDRVKDLVEAIASDIEKSKDEKDA